VQDRDSASLARAEKLRQKAPVEFQGCAGSGAPKPPRAPERDSYPAQRDFKAASAVKQDPYPAYQDSYPAQQDMPCTEPVASDMSYDPDAQERADLIEKCLAHGLTDEEIEGVLREHMEQKMMEKEKQVEERVAKAAARMMEHDAAPVKPASSSVASKRQAKAMNKKSTSFGPSDEEIAEIIEIGRTPSPEMNHLQNIPTMMKMKNEKAKQVAASGYNVGSHSEQDSRAAYLASQQTAAAAKARNRNGSGIF